MKIVDAQVHIWAANTPERPWPARAEPHRAPLGKDELLAEMDKAGVDGVVIDAPGARDQIAGWKKQKGMLGMRFTFHTETLRQPLLDGRFDWVWGEMEKAGIPAMVLFHHEYMHLADKVAERYPGLRLVLDHLGLKSAKDVSEATNFATLDKVLAARQAPQRGGQGLGHAVLRRRQDLSFPIRTPPYPPRFRRLRAQTDLLGHRLVTPPLHLPPGRHHVHGGNAVAERRRPRLGHGPRRL